MNRKAYGFMSEDDVPVTIIATSEREARKALSQVSDRKFRFCGMEDVKVNYCRIPKRRQKDGTPYARPRNIRKPALSQH